MEISGSVLVLTGFPLLVLLFMGIGIFSAQKANSLGDRSQPYAGWVASVICSIVLVVLSIVGRCTFWEPFLKNLHG